MTEGFRRTLPNAITLLRLVLAGAFFAALSFYRYPSTHVLWGNVAILMFILAVTTDALDGYLARKWSVQSVFGRIMDPFCDKILILGAFIMLAGPAFIHESAALVSTPQGSAPAQPIEHADVVMISGVQPWMVIVVLARELLVTGIRGEVEARGQSFASNWSGKAKMILQSITIPLVLAIVINFDMLADHNDWARWSRDVLVWLTVAVTVISGWPYITQAGIVLRANAGAGKSVS